MTSNYSDTSSPSRTLSENDLQELLLTTSSTHDNSNNNAGFLPLFQDLTPGFESLYTPYSPILDSYSNTDTTSSPTSQYEDNTTNMLQQDSKFHLDNDFLNIMVKEFFFINYFYILILNTSYCRTKKRLSQALIIWIKRK